MISITGTKSIVMIYVDMKLRLYRTYLRIIAKALEKFHSLINVAIYFIFTHLQQVLKLSRSKSHFVWIIVNSVKSIYLSNLFFEIVLSRSLAFLFNQKHFKSFHYAQFVNLMRFSDMLLFDENVGNFKVTYITRNFIFTIHIL